MFIKTFVVFYLVAVCFGSNASTHTYDSSLAMSCWAYGKAVNCGSTDIIHWNCTSCAAYNPGMVDVGVVDNALTGAQAFVGYNTRTHMVVMTFRGSVNIPNWINNLDFFYTPYPNPSCNETGGLGPNGEGCQVHRGFLNVYTSIRDALFAATTELLTRYTSASNGKPTLLVTGHSLGGALAILGGVDSSLTFAAAASEILIYTFGEPRVGNPQWATWASEHVISGGKQFRVTHEADPVPRLPPLSFGFQHVPHEVWYNNDLAGNTFTFCADNATTEDMTNCENTQTAFAVEDHLLYLGVPAGCQYN